MYDKSGGCDFEPRSEYSSTSRIDLTSAKWPGAVGHTKELDVIMCDILHMPALVFQNTTEYLYDDIKQWEELCRQAAKNQQ
jgi:hypothetical protein